METTNIQKCDEYIPPIIFTKQEYKILEYSRQFMTNQEIAVKLNISEVTVKSHRKNIMKKVGIQGKTAMNKFVMGQTYTKN